MVKKLLFVIVAGTILSSCSTEIASDKSNSEVIEIKEGDLTEFSKIWNVGEKNIDTVIFINAYVGARASMTFLNRKGEYLTFGENISNINFINNQTLSSVESLRNKTFVIVFRNLVMKGADSPEFAGDKELNLISGAIQHTQDLDFKELKSKYKFVEGRFNYYSMGDLAHYNFTLKNGESFDFGNCKDEYYDFEYDSESLMGKNFLIFYEDVEFIDPDNGPYSASIIHHLIPINTKNNKTSSKKEPKLSFDQLYPILKKSLLKEVCESYISSDEKNSLVVVSKETDMALSSWKWDLKNNPLVAEDIDDDGLIDYTIELSNEGGGCGGQIGQEERWTLFGVNLDRFMWTHIIPYRSETGNWVKKDK